MTSYHTRVLVCDLCGAVFSPTTWDTEYQSVLVARLAARGKGWRSRNHAVAGRSIIDLCPDCPQSDNFMEELSRAKSEQRNQDKDSSR